MAKLITKQLFTKIGLNLVPENLYFKIIGKIIETIPQNIWSRYTETNSYIVSLNDHDMYCGSSYVRIVEITLFIEAQISTLS